jgi:hypothetical protein
MRPLKHVLQKLNRTPDVFGLQSGFRILIAIVVTAILQVHNEASTQAKDRIRAEIVASWNFGHEEDKKRDGWPDGWTRTTGPAYPRFISIGIKQSNRDIPEAHELESIRRSASTWVLAREQKKWPWQVHFESPPRQVDDLLERTVLNPSLQIEMDGGAAQLLSPLVPIDPFSLYYATALVQAKSSDYLAGLTLRFLDSKKNLLYEADASPLVSNDNDPEGFWKRMATSSNHNFEGEIAYAQVAINVIPKSNKAFKGDFQFDDIQIFRSPRLTLSVDKPLHLYRKGEPVVVTCSATGMSTEEPSLILTLVDHDGNIVDSTDRQFQRTDSAVETQRWHGACKWSLPNLPSGYYEVSTQLTRGRSGAFELREQFIVLPEDGYSRPDNRFGWTMTEQKNVVPSTLETNQQIELMREARVGRAKVPIWFDAQDQYATRQYLDRLDRLQTSGIQCVGVIGSAPKSIRNRFSRLDSDDSGSAIEDSILLQSLLEPVMRQACIRLVDFQVGWDHETDFVSNPRLAPALETIRRMLNRYGQEAVVAAAHNPQLDSTQVANIDRWQLHLAEEMTAEETSRAMIQSPSKGQARLAPWLSLTPLSSVQYGLETRVQDLAARMLAVVKELGGAGATAWVSNPKSLSSGILDDDDGGPREMYLPFRTLSGALAGTRNIGSIPHPNLGSNSVLQSAEHGRLIAWSARPTVVSIYLGKSVRAQDVWGRPVRIDTVETAHGKEQVFELGRWPVIFDGIDLNVARWRMGIKLETTRIDQVVGQAQEVKVQFVNPLPVPVSGMIRIHAPNVFSEIPSAPLDIDANSSQTIVVPALVLADADTNITPIRIDFSMAGETPARFSIEEFLQIGTDDFDFNVDFEVDDTDRLWITVEATNQLKTPISLDCMLLIPNRPRERAQIAALVDSTTRTFVVNNASELVNQTIWLRGEQIGAKRIKNKRIQIQPPTR